METPLPRVRKGTWSKEEDDLLRACIQRYGEGKWRLVPQRAGLNRCRKSCRLRWMNYLKPDIKRGNFTEDEADMIMRFHSLGNRWSLIAARFPGRTSNDVKNYWNTHISKKLQCSSSQETTMKTHQVIRPRPLNFSRKRKGLLAERSDDSSCRDKRISAIDSDSGEVAVVVGADSSAKESEKEEEWWQSLLDDVIVSKGNEEDSCLYWCLGGEEQDKFLQPQFWDDDDDDDQQNFVSFNDPKLQYATIPPFY